MIYALCAIAAYLIISLLVVAVLYAVGLHRREPHRHLWYTAAGWLPIILGVIWIDLRDRRAKKRRLRAGKEGE